MDAPFLPRELDHVEAVQRLGEARRQGRDEQQDRAGGDSERGQLVRGAAHLYARPWRVVDQQHRPAGASEPPQPSPLRAEPALPRAEGHRLDVLESGGAEVRGRERRQVAAGGAEPEDEQGPVGPLAAPSVQLGEPPAVVGMLVEAEYGVGEEVGSCFVACHQEQAAEAEEFYVAQALPVNFGCQEGTDEVVAWVLPALFEDLCEVGVHPLDLLEECFALFFRGVSVVGDEGIGPAFEVFAQFGGDAQEFGDDSDR